MNVFNPQNQFHDICITIWASGFRDVEWESMFIDCDESYNIDWVIMYLEILDEDFNNYIRISKS